MAQGTRYPTLAFITGGVGEASDGIPPQPFETFCYDAALLRDVLDPLPRFRLENPEWPI